MSDAARVALRTWSLRMSSVNEHSVERAAGLGIAHDRTVGAWGDILGVVSAAYVALGDSFAAGIGSRTPGQSCRRDGGYPVLVARQLGLDLSYQACNGATTGDVAGWQIDALSARTRLVTLTVGGNDASFTTVVAACAKPRLLADGLGAIERARAWTRDHLPAALDGLLTEIRGRAPQAHVVVTGYPHLFAESDCHPLTFFDDEELAGLRSGTDALVDLVLRVAKTHGTTTVDVRERFAGRETCRSDSWIEHLTCPLEASFHPRAAGHRAYADLIAEAVRAVEVRSLRLAPVEPPLVVTGPDRIGSGGRFDVRTLAGVGRLRRPGARQR